MEALKVFNKDNKKWCIPKKGTPGYKMVRGLMSGEKEPPPTKESGSKKATIDVASAMEANQIRRGKLFGKFEDKMRMVDLAKKIKSKRE